MSQKIGSRYESLLRKYLEFYRDLHFGRRVPQTALQKHFVDLLKGRTKKTITIHERAYLAYLSDQKEKAAFVDKKIKTVRTVKKTVRIVTTPYISKSPKTYKRFIQEPWGSRSDWKRDSAANRSNAFKYKF